MLIDPAGVSVELHDLAAALNKATNPSNRRRHRQAVLRLRSFSGPSDRGAQGLVQKVQWRGPVRVSRVGGD